MTKEFYGSYCQDKNELPFVTLSGSVFLSGHHGAQWLNFTREGVRRFMCHACLHSKIQQTKMLVTCQRFGDWFLFGLVWQYSSHHKTYNKVRYWAYLYYMFCDQKRELNFCNGYLSLLYFCLNLTNFILNKELKWHLSAQVMSWLEVDLTLK